MSLYKRGGVWHYAFTVKGRRFRGSTDETNRYLAGLVEANEFKKARENRVNALTGTSPTLEAYAAGFTKWIEETHSIELKTKKCYQNGWRLLKATKLCKMKLDEITNRECEVVSFPSGPSNANQALRTLRRMLSMAKEDGKLQNIPSIKLRKEWPRSIAMTQTDASAIASKMKDGDSRDAFLVIRHSGPVRPSEVFEMRWEYVRLEASFYHNPKGKTQRSRRIIPLFKESLAILSRRFVEQGSPKQGWVFPSPKSACGHLTTIKGAFKDARDAARLPQEMVLYTARHGQATDMGQVATLKELMDAGGWSDAATAMRCQYPDIEKLSEKLSEAKTMRSVQ